MNSGVKEKNGYNIGTKIKSEKNISATVPRSAPNCDGVLTTQRKLVHFICSNSRQFGDYCVTVMCQVV